MRGIVAAALGAVLLVGACGAAAEPTEEPLLSLLPTQVRGVALSPIPVPLASLQENGSSGPDSREAQFIAITGATQDNFEGYILNTVNFGVVLAAYRVRGASKTSLEEGCAVYIYSSIDQLTRRDLGGRSVLLLAGDTGADESARAGCYVRDDVAFIAFGGSGIVVDYFNSLPTE